MAVENKNLIIYLVALDVLRRLAKQGIDRQILDRLNKRSAEKMNCSLIEIA
jgi:hypothetical protein